MDCQGAQSELFGHVQAIGRVTTAANAYDAIVFLASTGALDLFDDPLQLRAAKFVKRVELVKLVVESAMVAIAIPVVVASDQSREAEPRFDRI